MQQTKNHAYTLIDDDPWLQPYEDDIAHRIGYFKERLREIEDAEGSIFDFARTHEYLGIHYDAQEKGWWYREWAPRAHALFLTGDFNDWDRTSHPLQKNMHGIWEIFLPAHEYKDVFTHKSFVKVYIQGESGGFDRIPAYIRRVVQDPETKDFAGQLWFGEDFKWEDQQFDLSGVEEKFIYEAHIGLAQEKEGVGTFKEFTENVLPHIKQNGYNVIQLMAIAEHPYYGSFGYHVSNYYAPSSRFGTPEELKELINEAHKAGIAVVMDVVHSHAVKNFREGLNQFDGQEGCYFHETPRGYHTSWDSMVFDYGKWEVRKFLLSNLLYWMDEFHFDGFRFDGVTSMLYFHHGDYVSFDHYDKYFKQDVEWDAIAYLQLANYLVHQYKQGAITIAEDMSGMPGCCRSQEIGGLGFDFRLAMGIPDYWIKLLKHRHDEEWNMNELWSVLSNRRYKERHVAYAESHDQALVGDKTIAFWLMDKEMYFYMAKGEDNHLIDRGIALHKMIRLVTLAAGGESYMNFIGNEFGHPEWIDFPREGNNWSYKYARRQWSLLKNTKLKYHYMNDFDTAMIKMAKDNHLLESLPAHPLNFDEDNNVLVFERNNLIFLFNFHPQNSVFDYAFPVNRAGNFEIILNSDDESFGGHNRIDTSITYDSFDKDGIPFLRTYATNRTALVFKKTD